MTIYKTFRIVIAVVVVGCLGGRAQAGTPLGVDSFPNSRIVYHSDISTDDYRLALGALEKVNNIWRADQEQRLSGQLHRQTMELPAGFNAGEAYDFFIDQLDALEARELFSCQGRRCGSSNSWANTRFGVKQLYGLDQHQRYGVFEIVDARQQLYFVVVYTVERGNKRVYAQLDVLQSSAAAQGRIAASPDTIGQQLLQRGFYVLPGFRAGQDNLQQDEQHLQALAAALRKQRFLRVAVVGHDYGSGGEKQRQETSLGYAEHIRDLLGQQSGIDADKVEAYGVGGLAPQRRDGRSFRVEVVNVGD